MNSVAPAASRVLRPFSFLGILARSFCSLNDNTGDGFSHIEKLIKECWKSSDFDPLLRRISKDDDDGDGADDESQIPPYFSLKQHFFETTWRDADRVFDVLRQDDLGFNVHTALDELDVRVSCLLVRSVLLRILKVINYENKTGCARLAYKFFVWSGERENYRHTVNAYHLLMKIFAAAEEYKAMWRLLDEMTEKGYPATARTFNILICTCGEAGLQRKVVERFIRSKTFSYRPFKHSYNAILLGLLNINQYRLIEWVYQQMIADNQTPDNLTYNVLMYAKYRLGKLDHFHRLLDEMGKKGFSPDFYTFNILLHVLGKGDKPLTALNLLNHMKEVGVYPSALHFTTLIDGLSRAGNLDACKYFFDEMVKHGCKPDVVCYTVMVTGYIEMGELEKAQQVFDDMIVAGQLPNVFTYNSMIRGLCVAEKFEEACSMLKDMESRGCSPNFLVYNTLISNLQSAGKLADAHDIMRDMIEKGQYVHLFSKFKRYRRC